MAIANKGRGNGFVYGASGRGRKKGGEISCLSFGPGRGSSSVLNEEKKKEGGALALLIRLSERGRKKGGREQKKNRFALPPSRAPKEREGEPRVPSRQARGKEKKKKGKTPPWKKKGGKNR